MEKPSFDVELTRIRKLSESTLEFRFVRKDGNIVEFIPGQFFRFTFKDAAGSFERSYSLCNLGEDEGILDLVISKVEHGRATKLLFNCKEGLKASVKGPFGRLVLPKPVPERLILICTSVGIAPFLPILNSLYGHDKDTGQKGTGPKVLLLFGIRSPEECLYRDYFLSLKSTHASFDVKFCFSRKLPDNPQSCDLSGYVQDTLKISDKKISQDLALLCGNPSMVDSCFDVLKKEGFKSNRVIREKYVFAKDVATPSENKMTNAQKKLLEEKIKKYQ